MGTTALATPPSAPLEGKAEAARRGPRRRLGWVVAFVTRVGAAVVVCEAGGWREWWRLSYPAEGVGRRRGMETGRPCGAPKAVHSFAFWNGDVVGMGAPSTDDRGPTRRRTDWYPPRPRRGWHPAWVGASKAAPRWSSQPTPGRIAAATGEGSVRKGRPRCATTPESSFRGWSSLLLLLLLSCPFHRFPASERAEESRGP